MTSDLTIEPDPKRDHLLSNQNYDRLVLLVQKVLPALGTLYAGLAVFWDLPNGTEVLGSIALLATFGSVVLGISNRSYNSSEAKYDGQINISETADKKTFNIALNSDPEDIEKMSQVQLKINPIRAPEGE